MAGTLSASPLSLQGFISLDVGGVLPPLSSSMSIQSFIARCDRYCEAAQVSRTWLSKRLLKDTFRLDLLAAGQVDIGVKRMERALADLRELERTTPGLRRRGKSPTQGVARGAA
jgi:hypothetical protein